MDIEGGFVCAMAEAARSCQNTAALRTWTLAQLTALLPFDSAMFLSPRLDEAPSAVNKAGFSRLYWNYARDPERYRRGLAKGIRAAEALGGAYLDTEVFTADERRNLPLYAEMLRPQGITSQIVARPMFRGRSIGLLYLCRHGGGRFRHGDLDRMLRLLPNVALSHAAVGAVTGPPEPPAIAPALDGVQTLSRREREIVELVRRGLTNREIASVLGNRPNTVRNQVASIFRKLEVASRAELAGLISAR